MFMKKHNLPNKKFIIEEEENKDFDTITFDFKNMPNELNYYCISLQKLIIKLLIIINFNEESSLKFKYISLLYAIRINK